MWTLKNRWGFLISVGVMLILVQTACLISGPQKPTPSPTLEATLKQEATNTPPQESAPGEAFEGAELPEDFPESFPIPEGAHVGSSINLPGENNFRVFLGLELSREDALAFYREELPATGWTITADKDTSRGRELSCAGTEYEGQLLFVAAETGVGVDVHLYPPESGSEMTAIPEGMGESISLGEEESDFPADFPLPESFQPAQLRGNLPDQGYQLAFCFEGPPELAMVDLTMALANEGWTTEDPDVETALHVYLLPFSNPASGFEGYAMITDNPDVVGIDSLDVTLVALHPGERE